MIAKEHFDLDLDQQHSPGYRSHNRKGHTALATPATASARSFHMYNLLGLLKLLGSKVSNSFLPGLPAQGMLRRRSSIGSGPGII
eukprot:357697-Chlamydomonas_euryale.AAC.2